ncbi:hypothetical protein K502DRAFT_364006 [Neoconidiobolus thromboides FSU 785]|nr:hypothetical protein K502DRAFT_364006 [Neoconidiobolus thromboides FSU 785]
MKLNEYIKHMIEKIQHSRFTINEITLINFKLTLIPWNSTINNLLQQNKMGLLICNLVLNLAEVNDKQVEKGYLVLLINSLNNIIPNYTNKQDKEVLVQFKIFYVSYYAYLLQLNNELIEAEANYQAVLSIIKRNKELRELKICILNNLVLLNSNKGNDNLSQLLFQRMKKECLSDPSFNLFIKDE